MVPPLVIDMAPDLVPPVFWTVNCCVEPSVFTWVEPNSWSAGVRVSWAGEMPVPVRLADGEPPAVDVTDTEADLAPVDVGAKATWMVHD